MSDHEHVWSIWEHDELTQDGSWIRGCTVPGCTKWQRRGA